MRNITFTDPADKLSVIIEMTTYIQSIGLSVVEKDLSKPWGAYFVINEQKIDRFITEFFAGVAIDTRYKLTPKMLLVAPTEILSWQYHHRRSELWKVVSGPVEIAQSATDSQTPVIRKYTGDLIAHDALTRHRLIGAGVWGVVAEIWQHVDPQNPSDENDIVRVSDAYDR